MGPGFGPGAGPAHPYTADSPTRGDAKLDNGDPAEHAYRARRQAVKRERRELDEARAQELKDGLYDLALNSGSDRARIAAADSWLNRFEGMPVARNINLSVNDISALSDTDLDAEIARLAGTEGGAGAGAAGEASPDMPE